MPPVPSASAASTSLEIELLGQAASLLRAPGATILTDPWFSGPAHLDSWVPFPNWNEEELRGIRTRCEQATHVYLSHSHEDHFDIPFLKTLSRKVILVGDFVSSRMGQMLDAIRDHHEIVRLKHGERLALTGDVAATVFLEQPSFRTNSMLLLEAPGGSILDANDCGLNTTVLEQIAALRRPTVFMYTLNFVANGYPFPYLRRHQGDLAERILEVRNDIVGSYRKALEVLQPQLGIAFAGPVTFADEVNEHLDTFPETLDWSQMVEDLSDAARVVWPAPSSVIRLANEEVGDCDIEGWRGFLDARREARVVASDDAVISRTAPTQDQLLDDAQGLADRLGVLAARIPTETVRTSLVLGAVEGLSELESDPPLYRILVRPGARATLLAADREVKAPFLSLSTLPSILSDYCTGKVDYDAVMLSARARFERVPDVFDPYLHNLLRFGDDEASSNALVQWYAEAARRRASETLTVTHEGKAYTIPRYCPHEGEAFDKAEIVDGCLVCPRHRWHYDLESGRCVRGGGGAVSLYAGRESS